MILYWCRVCDIKSGMLWPRALQWARAMHRGIELCAVIETGMHSGIHFTRHRRRTDSSSNPSWRGPPSTCTPWTSAPSWPLILIWSEEINQFKVVWEAFVLVLIVFLIQSIVLWSVWSFRGGLVQFPRLMNGSSQSVLNLYVWTVGYMSSDCGTSSSNLFFCKLACCICLSNQSSILIKWITGQSRRTILIMEWMNRVDSRINLEARFRVNLASVSKEGT